MNQRDALRVVEELRKGIPPVGYVEHFTVGRQSDIDALQGHLDNGNTTVLLLRANWGSGKSHLLRLVRERALRMGYAVSYVQLDARSGVRFNRMDQIMGAILRQVELPIRGASIGVRGLMNFLCETIENARTSDDAEFWDELSSNGKWDFSEALKSEGLYVAIRAWMTGDTEAQETVVDWLQNPANYRTQRRRLYETLVSGLRGHFRDPRPDYQFYQDGVFIFFHDGYRQSWDALQDTHLLLRRAGLKGFILLFDEFEDVLTAPNMRIDHQEAAFWNLFRFFSGKKFEGMSFYAVTPGFVQKCKERLIERHRFDFDYSRFDHLPTFAMSPLSERELQELARRIIAAHALAYGYEAGPDTVAAVRQVVERAAQSPVQNRARHTIREVVAKLDSLMNFC
ncbi:MAG: ATP-binding protein [Verrucomicrobiae bacterium]|nr:ATP-binding protein [Verrucomicrobiae bacterium]